MRYECFFDGGCGPVNPGGHGTAGAVIYDENAKLVWVLSDYIGRHSAMSNNLAEYYAFNKLCRRLEDLMKPGDVVAIHGDSNLVVKQMSGKWKIKGGMYVSEARAAISSVNRIRAVCKLVIDWIPREANQEADQLCRDAYPRHL